MTTTKTAISLDKELLEKAEKIASFTGNSRSGLIAIALKEYIKKWEQEKMLAELNQVYDDESINTELIETSSVTKTYFTTNIVENEQW